MFKMRKAVSLPLICLLIVSSMAACGKGAEKKAGDTGPAVKTEAQNVPQGKIIPYEKLFKFSYMEPLTVTPMDSNNMIEQEIQKRTNSQIEYTQVPGSNFTEKLNVTLASNSLPDLICTQNNSQMNQWIAQGAVIPLDDLLKKYGANITRFWNDDTLKNVKYPGDGKIYSIPQLIELKEINSVAIREDWLKKLNLKVPVSLEEWEQVLKAFKEKDPDGNGKNDTIPWAGSLSPFMDAFEIRELWNVTEDNKLVSKYEHKSYKAYLETLNKFYKAGLIDQEFPVRNRDSKAYYELFSTGKAGAGMFSADRSRVTTIALRSAVPGAKMMPIAPIKGIKGKQMIQGRNIYGPRTAITVKGKETDKLTAFVDWIFSDAGIELTNYGVEGKHHNKVNGKPVLVPPYNQGWDALRKEGLNKYGTTIYWSKDAYMQSLMMGKKLEEMDEVERITYDGLFLNTPFIYMALPNLDTKAHQEKGPDVWPFLEEMEIKAIIGAISIDDFSKALEDAKKRGLDQITKETNDLWNKIK